jgi:preprotein translocase subunit SecD
VRIRPWHMLIFISILTMLAVWIDLPGTTGNVFGLKDNVDVHQGLDLQGGLQVLLQANPPGGGKVDSGALEGTRDTIERRVNGLGVSEPVIQTQNNNQIIVELPGVKDPEEAVRVLKETALLEIIDPQGQFLPEGTEVNTTLGTANEAEAGATPEASPGASPVGSPEASPEASPVASPAATASATPAGPVYTTIISGKDLKDAYITRTSLGAPAVGFEVKSEGASKLYDFTSANLGSYMSIALDKKIISSATIQGAISNQGQITGMSAQEVNSLVVQLKAGALSVPLEVKSSRTVGPQLGQDSIDHSLIAGIIGLGTVALFMILYYRVPGALAVIALMIYTSLTFALFKLIPVTMTLAGIAGFILSIGMAVDANVLIFARMKDEIRLGRTLNNAVEAGFDHAWPSIRDSNISTMITSAILYWFGRYTGASIITGFALTLFVGVSVSMFTAITVTRTFLRLLISAGWANHPRWFGVEDPRELAAGATAD